VIQSQLEASVQPKRKTARGEQYDCVSRLEAVVLMLRHPVKHPDSLAEMNQ